MTASPLDRVTIGDHTIAYRRAGSGPPLVLLHGFLCDSRCWRAQLEGLADAFTVVAWDAPGAGASSDPPPRFSLRDWTTCLASFLDALDIERAHICGLSWGGLVAQDLFAAHRARVRSLVLADTYAGWKGSLPDQAERRYERCVDDSTLPAQEFASRWVPEMFGDAVAPAAVRELTEVFEGFHPEGFRLMARTLADEDTRAVLRAIDVPTLLIWGEHDARSPLSVAEVMRAEIPGAELTVIEGAGHVSNMERPQDFNTLVRAFCSGA